MFFNTRSINFHNSVFGSQIREVMLDDKFRDTMNSKEFRAWKNFCEAVESLLGSKRFGFSDQNVEQDALYTSIPMLMFCPPI